MIVILSFWYTELCFSSVQPIFAMAGSFPCLLRLPTSDHVSISLSISCVADLPNFFQEKQQLPPDGHENHENH